MTTKTTPDLGGYWSSYQYWPGSFPSPYQHHNCPARWTYCPDCGQRIPSSPGISYTPVWLADVMGTQVTSGVSTYNAGGCAHA